MIAQFKAALGAVENKQVILFKVVLAFRVGIDHNQVGAIITRPVVAFNGAQRVTALQEGGKRISTGRSRSLEDAADLVGVVGEISGTFGIDAGGCGIGIFGIRVVSRCVSICCGSCFFRGRRGCGFRIRRRALSALWRGGSFFCSSWLCSSLLCGSWLFCGCTGRFGFRGGPCAGNRQFFTCVEYIAGAHRLRISRNQRTGGYAILAGNQRPIFAGANHVNSGRRIAFTFRFGRGGWFRRRFFGSGGLFRRSRFFGGGRLGRRRICGRRFLCRLGRGFRFFRSTFFRTFCGCTFIGGALFSGSAFISSTFFSCGFGIAVCARGVHIACAGNQQPFTGVEHGAGAHGTRIGV